MRAALRREAAAAVEAKRQAHEVALLQGALAERETDLERFKRIIKLKEGMISRLEVRAPVLVCPLGYTISSSE